MVMDKQVRELLMKLLKSLENNKFYKFLVYSLFFIFLWLPVSVIFNEKMYYFLILCIILQFIFKKIKFNNKSKVFNFIDKYGLLILILICLFTRICSVLIMNERISQISNFKNALDTAITLDFQTPFYRCFSHWTLYPLILSFVFRLFGSSQFVALMFNVVIQVLTCVLIYFLALKITKNKKIAFISSLIYTLLPSSILYVNICTQEHIAIFLVLLCIYLFFSVNKLYNENKFYLYIV